MWETIAENEEYGGRLTLRTLTTDMMMVFGGW